MTTKMLVSVLLVLGLPTANAQTPRVRLMLGQHGYVEPQHRIRGVSAVGGFVFYGGEDIALELRVANWDDTDVVVPAHALSPTDVVSVSLVRREGATFPELSTRLISTEAPSLVGASHQRFAADWGDRLVLPPKWHLTIPVIMRSTESLAPGSYELRVTGIRLPCEGPCEVRNHGGVFRFEVKALNGLPERLDQLFRRATRHIESHEPEEARGVIARMLALYPRSSAAYQLRGREAELLGRWTEASEAYEQALRLLETGQDQLRREIGEPGSLRGFLRARADEARRRERP